MPATITAASPTTGPLTLNITRGKTAEFAIAVFQADGVTPQDLTDCSLLFYAQIGPVLITKTSPSGDIVITSTTGGLATLRISPADTVLLAIGGVVSGPYELTLQQGIYYFDLTAGTAIVYSNVGTP